MIITKKRSKGIAGLTIGVIGAVGLFVILLSTIIPFFFFRIHLNTVVEVQYEYNNAELVLLELLSDEEIYDKIVMLISGLENDDEWIEDVMKPRLDGLMPNSCYIVSSEDAVFIDTSGDNCDPTYATTTHVVMPYGGTSVGKLTLEISEEPTMSEDFMSPGTGEGDDIGDGSQED